MANSGLFVWGDPIPATGTPYTRGIEVQVLANAEKEGQYTSDGDVFAIWGAVCKPDRPHPKGAMRCLPSEKRTKPAGQWNHYKVIAQDGVLKLHVNGKEVSGVSECNPRKGYLALESEGAECHFRNIKIKELPGGELKPEQVAKTAEGHELMFNGLDLAGWKTADDSWKAGDGRLKAAGKALLGSDRKFSRGELVFDWRFPAKAAGECAVNLGGATVMVSADGSVRVGVAADNKVTASEPTKTDALNKPGSWNRTVLTFDGKVASAQVNGKEVGKVESPAAALPGPLVFHPADGLELMNVFVRVPKEK
jgi:hypothetical protein